MQVIAELGDDVDIVLDGGPCKYGTSSTVAMVGNARRFDCCGKASTRPHELKRMSDITFLFVCTGNTCRSPMAEGLFRKYLAEKIGCDVDELGRPGL